MGRQESGMSIICKKRPVVNSGSLKTARFPDWWSLHRLVTTATWSLVNRASFMDGIPILSFGHHSFKTKSLAMAVSWIQTVVPLYLERAVGLYSYSFPAHRWNYLLPINWKNRKFIASIRSHQGSLWRAWITVVCCF